MLIWEKIGTHFTIELSSRELSYVVYMYVQVLK